MKYPTEDFIDAIRYHDGPPTTAQIAEAVSCEHDTAYKRLKQLRENNRVSSRKVGNTLIWSVTE